MILLFLFVLLIILISCDVCYKLCTCHNFTVHVKLMFEYLMSYTKINY